MKDLFDKLAKYPLVMNLLLAVVITVALFILTLKWLEVYTRHNEAVIVPDVKGLNVERAAEFFKSNKLRYSIIDSVFSRDVTPGAIVEISPAAGSKVKENRIVFVTVNALTSQMASIPEVADLSLRQAYALLRARGFESVDTEYVKGEYKDLALRVELRGITLEKGELVALNAPLVLVVSDGRTSEEFIEDSLQYNSDDHLPLEPFDNDEENWF